MAASIHGTKPLRIAALFHARRIVRKSAKAAFRLIPKKAKASSIVFWVVIAFLFAPLFVLILYSFNASRSGEWAGFSLVWYKKLFLESPELWRAFKNSLAIALSSAAMATVLGTLAAVGTARYSFKLKSYVATMSFIPMILPEIVVGVSLLVFFAGIGLKLGMISVWIAHTTFNIPFVYLLVSARLEESDPTVVEAARDLGASELQTLFKVVIPMALPGVASAFLTAVTLSLEDFVITFFVSGPGATTLPLYIYSMIRFGLSPVVNALSAVMVAGTVLLVYPMRNFLKVFASN
ncbi:MAG: spermidine/putrescine transport system permease protein [Spirochaetes bacterium]|nr:MAG: spermidine/putrescine transport system permease protein [Spirochaetota bacterium]